LGKNKYRGEINMDKGKKTVENLTQQDELKELDNLEDSLNSEELEKLDSDKA